MSIDAKPREVASTSIEMQYDEKAGDRSSCDPVVVALGERVRRYRMAAALSLANLAELSGVSRAMLSKVERGEKSPTIAIIVRIASGLGLSLSELMGAVEDQSHVALIKPWERISFTDPESGFERQLLSPSHLENGMEFLLHKIPAGQSSGILAAYRVPTEKYLVVIEGALTVHLGRTRHIVNTGDSFYFQIKAPYRFVNEGRTDCSYYLVVVRKPLALRASRGTMVQS